MPIISFDDALVLHALLTLCGRHGEAAWRGQDDTGRTRAAFRAGGRQVAFRHRSQLGERPALLAHVFVRRHGPPTSGQNTSCGGPVRRDWQPYQLTDWVVNAASSLAWKSAPGPRRFGRDRRRKPEGQGRSEAGRVRAQAPRNDRLSGARSSSERARSIDELKLPADVVKIGGRHRSSNRRMATCGTTPGRDRQSSSAQRGGRHADHLRRSRNRRTRSRAHQRRAGSSRARRRRAPASLRAAPTAPSVVIAWSCTAGRFNWRYGVDETVHVISGEVFVTDESGAERRLGPGDMAFFPAGSRSLWRVPVEVRKLAVCRHALPKPVGFAVRAWHKLIALVTGEAGGMELAPDKRAVPTTSEASPSKVLVARMSGATSGYRWPSRVANAVPRMSLRSCGLRRHHPMRPSAGNHSKQIVARLARRSR